MGRRPLRARASWASWSWTQARSCRPLRLGLHNHTPFLATPGKEHLKTLQRAQGVLCATAFVRPHSCLLLQLGLHRLDNISDNGSKGP